MNCWLIGVTLQCLGSNELTFVTNYNSGETRQHVSIAAPIYREQPKLSPENARYIEYMFQCGQVKQHAVCHKEYKP